MIYKYLKLTRLDISFNLLFHSSIVMVGGDSATGKTFLYETFSDYSKFNKNIKCINDDSIDSDDELSYKLSKYTGKLVIIDNADIVLSRLNKVKIAMDVQNQYVIFGRNSAGYHLTPNGYAELSIKGAEGNLVYPFI